MIKIWRQGHMLMDPEFAENIFFLSSCVGYVYHGCVFVCFFKLYKMTFIKVISSDLNWNILFVCFIIKEIPMFTDL